MRRYTCSKCGETIYPHLTPLPYEVRNFVWSRSYYWHLPCATVEWAGDKMTIAFGSAGMMIPQTILHDDKQVAA
jgi:hypothetical protein